MPFVNDPDPLRQPPYGGPVPASAPAAGGAYVPPGYELVRARPRPGLLRRLFHALWTVIKVAWKLFIILIVLGTILALWMGRNGGAPAVIRQNSGLVLVPSGEVVEQLDPDAAGGFFRQFNSDPPAQTALPDLIAALDAAAKDDRIPFVVLKLDYLSGIGMAQLEELGDAMQRFRKSGKKIYAHEQTMDQRAYFLAAQADDISLDPMGGVLIDGFSSFPLFFKDALDKLGVTVNVFRVGEYKSAVEPFVRNDMSPESKAANQAWLNDLWGRYDTRVANVRKLPARGVTAYADSLPEAIPRFQGDTAKLALAAKLADRLETRSEFRLRMAALKGKDGEAVGTDDDTGTFHQIPHDAYLRSIRQNEAIDRKKSKNPVSDERIGLIVVEGEIIDGRGDGGTEKGAGETIAALLDKARRDDDVKAVVLRVNSPGGSVTASEQIRRAVRQLKADGKPVVASMSTLAASGGYWISMDADRILAQPSTITGSIGIFGLIPTFEQPATKLGVHTDGVGTTRISGLERLDRALPPETKAMIQPVIEHGYAEFIGGVSTGRKIPLARVDEIARGRVWSATAAKGLGLVDAFGGLEAARLEAVKLAKLDNGEHAFHEFTPDAEFKPAFLLRLFGGRAAVLPAWLETLAARPEGRAAQAVLAPLATYNDPAHAYVRCTECEAPPTGRGAARAVASAPGPA